MDRRKSRPERLEETRLLYSLPVSPRAIFSGLVLSDIQSSLWMPVFSWVVLIELYRAAPIPHLCRLAFLAACAYAFATVLNGTLHLYSLKHRQSQGKSYPSEQRPGILLFSTALFAMIHFTCILFPNLSSGCGFIIGSLALPVGTACAWSAGGRLLKDIQDASIPFYQPSLDAGILYKTRNGNAFSKRPIQPLLLNHVLRWKRGGTRSAVMTILVPFAAAYAASANNSLSTDRAAVVSGITVLFTIFSLLGVMNRFSVAEEPPEILYCLPVSRKDLFAAVFIPAWLWLTAAVAGLAGLLAAFGTHAGAILKFMAFSFSAVIACSFTAAAFLCGSYPDVRAAERRFVIWVLGVFLAVCAVYPLRFFWAVVFTAIPIRRMLLNRLYRFG